MSPLTEQQREAVESIDKHVLVSAGAGSGKTHVLVERYLEILRSRPELSVANLVAVTFTRKAANEMRTRLKARIQELLTAGAGKEKSRWLDCLADVDTARIGTIHSLCESILKAFPAEAGIDPRFAVLDDLERAQLLEASVRTTIQQVIAEQSAEHDLLLSYPIESIKEWVEQLLKAFLQYQEAKELLPEGNGAELERYCAQVIERAQDLLVTGLCANSSWRQALSYLEENQWQDGKALLERYRTEIIELAGPVSAYADAGATPKTRPSLSDCLSRLKCIAEIRAGVAGGNSEQAKALREAIRVLVNLSKDCRKELPAEMGDADPIAFQRLQALINLADRAIESYDTAKQARQGLDYNDLVWIAHRLLCRADSPARRYYHENLEAILIDEFQDTNNLQARLIASLAGPQTRLFLIGDDKQSIYKFQGADVSIFNSWKAHLAERLDFPSMPAVPRPGSSVGRDRPAVDPEALCGPGLVIGLDQSFRSHPALVSFVNVISESLLKSDAGMPPYKARHQPLVPWRGDSPESERVDVLLVERPAEAERFSAADAADLEAQAVALWILEKISVQSPVLIKGSGELRPIQFGDFAVLTQRNRDFVPLEVALARLRIPYVTMAGTGYLERQEIYDIENLIRFLVCPADSQSLLGALRSPMFAVSDDIIHGLRAGSKQSLWEQVQTAVREKLTGVETLLRAAQIIEPLMEVCAARPVDELVRRIILDTDYDLVLMAAPNGRQRTRNLWKLAHLSAEHRHLSASDFVLALDSMREIGVKQADAPLDSRDSVKLMTIHGSKGLEFPAVILPALSQPVLRNSGKLLLDREYGVAFDATRSRDEEKPSLFQAARILEQDMEAAERKRLLYVAMTRARDYLCMVLDRGSRRRISFAGWIGSALQIDSDGQTTTPGRYSIGGDSGRACYSLSVHSAASLAGSQPGSPECTIPGPQVSDAYRLGPSSLEEGCLLDLDLIKPLDNRRIEPSWSWQDLLRVTPAQSGVRLEATVVGQFFHALIERLPGSLERPSAQTMAAIAAGPGIRAVHPQIVARLLEEGDHLLDRFYASALYELMLSASRRLHEVPYLVVERFAARSARPDLLLLDREGRWYVIDFKTDHFQIAELENQAEQHRQQLNAYVSDIEKLTAVRATAALYFAQHGLLHELSAGE